MTAARGPAWRARSRATTHSQREFHRLAGALFMMVVLGSSSWWATHPDAFRPSGNVIGSRLEVGETKFIANLVADPTRPVAIVAIAPHEMSGAAARVAFRACLPRDQVAGTSRPLEEICRATKAVEGSVIHPGPDLDGWRVVAEVTLLEEGQVSIKGFSVSYREGIRRGWQVTGVHAVFYSEGHGPAR